MMKRSNIKLAALALAGLGMVMSSCAYAKNNGMKLSSNGGIMSGKVEDPHWFGMGGFLQFDQVFVGSESTNGIKEAQGYANSANLRRARLHAAGGLGKDWSYFFGFNFAGTAPSPQLKWDAVYASYKGFENTEIQIGLIGPYFSLSNEDGTTQILTMERPAAANNFAPANSLGINATHHLEMMTLSASLWAPKDGGTTNGGTTVSSAASSDNLSASARITFAPVHTPNYVLHSGISGIFTNYNAITTVASTTQPFSANTEILGRSGSWPSAAVSTAIPTSVSDSNNLGIRNTSVAGIEAGYIWGPLSMTAEYLGARINRTAGNQNFSYTGWYANVAYSVTGESRGYNFESGTFSNPVPTASTGAVELFAQYSMMNLRDHNLGSIENDTTVGVNWHLSNNMRLVAEYSRANMRRLITPVQSSALLDQRKVDLFGLRVQANFS